MSTGPRKSAQKVAWDFAQVAAWARANDRSILLGGFGSYYHSGAPVEIGAAYTSAVGREAEAAGFGRSYCQFDSDFIALVMDNNAWNEPIVRALIPERR